MWVPPEIKDPVVYHHPTRKSVGYFAAVRLRDGEFLFRREAGRFNGDSFWEFLKIFREASAVGGRRVVAISDNAQYHRSKLHLAWRLRQLPATSAKSSALLCNALRLSPLKWQSSSACPWNRAPAVWSRLW
jgi:hypothetical protein